MGARVTVGGVVPRRLPGIDIRVDGHGEYFDIAVEQGDAVEYEVVDIRPQIRHLLLMARRENGKQKFLCGHDERHWFVCAVPGASVSSVEAAMEALQPREVRGAVQRRVKRAKNRLRRRNKAFIRQGEWFFVPAPELNVNPNLVLKNEPISRGRGGNSHLCQYVFRAGGESVWVCPQHPEGVTEDRYRHLLRTDPQAGGWN